MDEKPRDFWICPYQNEVCGSLEDLKRVNPEADPIHVIRYSAYQALEATEEGWRLKAREAMAQRDRLLAGMDRVGSWLSAAMEDPKVCKELKDDIEAFFESLS